MFQKQKDEKDDKLHRREVKKYVMNACVNKVKDRQKLMDITVAWY
jgi:hypothetical protein